MISKFRSSRLSNKFSMSQAWDKKKILSPSEALQCSTPEPQRLNGKQSPLWNSCMTSVLHTGRISNVDSIMFCKLDKKMISCSYEGPLLYMNFVMCTSQSLCG